MKRVLLITRAFPPQPSPGALRPGYLAKYLPEFGWEVTVVTRPTGASAPVQVASVMAAPSRMRRILGRARDTLAFPDDYAAWIPVAVASGLRAMRGRRFDAILSTALPMSAHVAAWILSRASGTPWIADYRDAWSGNPYMPWGPVKASLERSFERCMIKSAARVTTISDGLAKQLAETHCREVMAIPNGYDPAEWPEAEPAPPSAFSLIYTGNLYDGKRSPETLFRALRELRDEGNAAGEAIVHFYSANNIGLSAMAQRYGIETQIRLHGLAPRADVLQHQRDSAVLLILLNTDPKTKDETGSKFLEYLGARRPMLVCGPPESIMRAMVESCRLGWFASDAPQVKQALCTAYARFTAGEAAWHADTATLPTARDLARGFASQLDSVSAPTSGEWRRSAAAELESVSR